MPAIWNDAALVQFRVDIESFILTKIPFCATPYCIGKFNLLMNRGIIQDDQDPHFDYPPKIIL